MEILNTIEKRRSIRKLGKDIDILEEEVIEIIKNTLKHTPAAFNSQSQRVMILLNKQHIKFWDLVKEELSKIVPKANIDKTYKKLEGFREGFGTILYFDDTDITNSLIEKYPLYKDNIINWSQQQNGMLQINIWNVLTSKNIVSSLQHYTEVIEEKAKQLFEIPDNWKMIAQMPFGNINEEVKTKEFIDIEERLTIKK